MIILAFIVGAIVGAGALVAVVALAESRDFDSSTSNLFYGDDE